MEMLIREIGSDLTLSTGTIAQILGVDERTVERWTLRQSKPRGKALARLTELIALRDLMLSVLGSDVVARNWLMTSSTYLGGKSPGEVLRAGRIDKVRADLEGLAAGVYL